MSIIGDPSADVVISQQMWINITSEAERLAAMAKECAAERDALRAELAESREQLTRELKISLDAKAALRAEVERLRISCESDAAGKPLAVCHKLATALAEVERLKANAERYQWMKRVHADGDESVTEWIGFYAADQWDEEIDRERLPSPTTEVPK